MGACDEREADLSSSSDIPRGHSTPSLDEQFWIELPVPAGTPATADEPAYENPAEAAEAEPVPVEPEPVAAPAEPEPVAAPAEPEPVDVGRPHPDEAPALSQAPLTSDLAPADTSAAEAPSDVPGAFDEHDVPAAQIFDETESEAFAEDADEGVAAVVPVLLGGALALAIAIGLEAAGLWSTLLPP